MSRRKWIAALALLLALLVPGTALAAAGDANLARGEEMYDTYQDYVMFGCVLDDALYLCGSSHIFIYRVGDADLSAVEYEFGDPEGEIRNIALLYSDGEALRALCAVYEGDEEGGSRLKALEIVPVEIDGTSVRFGEAVPVDMDELCVDYGDGANNLVQINDGCYVGGKLMLFVFDESGKEGLYALDVDGGAGEYVDVPEGISGIAPCGDRLLIETYDFDAPSFSFYLYDPESEALSSACAPIALEENAAPPAGLACDPDGGRVFFLSNGYVMAMEDFDFAAAQPVAELAAAYYDNRRGLLLPGNHYVHISYDSVAVRATDPGALPETRLVVQGGGYDEASLGAYYGFGSAHGDVAVVFNYSPVGEVVEAMMNRDDSVDVYILTVSSEDYDAVFHRGYMMELDDPAILEAVDGMYPAVQDAVRRDGALVAVPIRVYGWLPGLDYEGFERIGIAREDVPTTWKGLMELLPQLPALIGEDASVRIFSEYETQESVRAQFFAAILTAWRVQSNASGRELRYDDPVLIELMELVAGLDLEALGLPSEQEGGSYAYAELAPAQGRSYQLIEFSVGCTIGNFYSQAEPALLRVLPDEEAYLPLSMNVAFVNPYSRHPELAQEFLVAMLDSAELTARYNLSDAYNEPVRSARTLAYMQETQEEIDALQAQLETADPADAPAIQERIDAAQSYYDQLEASSWEISEREIAWYRAHGDRLTVDRFDFLGAADEDGELSDLAEQMLAGRIRPAEFLREVDRKVRMRAMEGN